MQNKKGLAAIIALVIVAVIVVVCLLKGCGSAKEFKVTFDSMGGSSVNNQIVKEGEKVAKPSDPTRDGYTFEGWYLDLDDEESYDFDSKVTKDITLYAKWSTVTGGEEDKCTLTCSEGYTLDKENCKCVKEEEKVPVTSVTANKTSLTMTVGETFTVKLTIKPTNATNKTATWKSSNTKVVTVDKNGKITAKGVGTATVTATVDGKTVKIQVTVTAKETTPTEVKVTGITISGNDTMKYGASQTLNATVTPDNATNKSVTWSVSSGATIDQNGKLTITGDIDEVTVTATANDGSGVSATFKVTVEAVYTITLDPIDMGDHKTVYNYNYTITRNGRTFTNYSDLVVNGTKVWDKAIQASAVESGTNATMTVNGKTVTLTYNRKSL